MANSLSSIKERYDAMVAKKKEDKRVVNSRGENSVIIKEEIDFYKLECMCKDGCLNTEVVEVEDKATGEVVERKVKKRVKVSYADAAAQLESMGLI